MNDCAYERGVVGGHLVPLVPRGRGVHEASDLRWPPGYRPGCIGQEVQADQFELFYCNPHGSDNLEWIYVSDSGRFISIWND